MTIYAVPAPRRLRSPAGRRPGCYRHLGFVAIALALALPPAAWATTHIVDPGGGGDALTIAGAVSAASDGDTIRIASGTYTEFVNLTEDLVIRAETYGQVTWQPSGGTCIEVDLGGALEIHGVRFTGNGAAISILTGEACKVWDCTFEDLTATGGGLGIYVTDCAIDVNECSFANLHATGTLFGGTGIYVYNSAGKVSRIANCTFEHCTTFSDGGAIDARCTGMTIENCEFRNCDALYGGAVYFLCHNSQIRNCLFENNHCDYFGGAVYVSSNSGDEISDCIFRDNTADSRGGAIYAAADVADALVSSNLFAGNIAGQGGAIYQDGFADVIEYCTFYDNEGPSGGAAIYVYYGAPQIIQSIFCRHADAAAIRCSGASYIGCNAFWDNFAGDVDVCVPPVGANGNVFQDPEFCDAPSGDFTVAFDSPCAAAQAPGVCVGQMGRYGAACDQTAIDLPSWGKLRLMFRNE